MVRIFIGLAGGQTLVMILAGIVGIMHIEPGGHRHILLGMVSLVLGCLVQVVVFTYLTVTGKMMGQAIHLGKLDRARFESIAKLKRSMTHWLAVAAAGLVAIAISGGWNWRTGDAGGEHMLIAMSALALHLVVFYREFSIVAANTQLLDVVMGEYKQKRQQSAVRGACATNAPDAG